MLISLCVVCICCHMTKANLSSYVSHRLKYLPHSPYPDPCHLPLYLHLLQLPGELKPVWYAPGWSCHLCQLRLVRAEPEWEIGFYFSSHVTLVVYLLSLIWILPVIPSFFLPPAPHFLIPNSCYVHLFKNKTLCELLWVAMMLQALLYWSGWAKLCCSNKQPPLLTVSKQQRSECCSCYSSSSLAWQRVLFFTGIQACRLMLYGDVSSMVGQRERKLSSQTRNIHLWSQLRVSYRALSNHKGVRKHVSTTYLGRKDN